LFTDIFTLKGRSPALLISIFVHVLIFLLLSRIDNHVPEKVSPPIKAIKSYLYKRPAPPKEKVIPEPTKTTKIAVVPLQQKEENEKKEITPSTTPPVNKEINIESIAPLSQQKDNRELSNKVVARPTFSALEQLNKLQNSINNKVMQQGLQQYQQHRSVSVMHGKPIPVQHSKKQLTEEEKKAAITTRLSDNVSLEKGDDGSCFVERDLSNVGMEGVKSRETFACGPNKFDKSFRAHMKKIKEKLGK